MVGAFAFADPTGANVAVSQGIDPTLAGQLARDPTLSHLPCSGPQPGAVYVARARAWAAAAQSVCLADTNQLLGTVIAVTPLDSLYLQRRVRVDSSVALALVTSGSCWHRPGRSRRPPS